MAKKILLTGLMLALLTSSAMAQVVSRIAAVIDDDIITTRQLEQRLEQAGGDSSDFLQQRKMLDGMINELLMQHRAEEIGIEVADQDIDQAIGDVESKNNITRDQLEQALLNQGTTMERYRNQLRQQILRYKLRGREVQSKVDITNQEIRDYYKKNLEDYKETANVRLSRISLAVGNDAAQAQEDAQLAQQKLREGESVADVLLDLSSHTPVEGGEMGKFKPGELSSSFEKAIAGLDAGGVSPIITSNGMLHILKVEEKSTGGYIFLNKVEDDIRRELRQKKVEKKLEKWREDLKKNAYIDIRL